MSNHQTLRRIGIEEGEVSNINWENENRNKRGPTIMSRARTWGQVSNNSEENKNKSGNMSEYHQ